MKQLIENWLLAVSSCSVLTPVEIPSTCSILSVKQSWNLVLFHSLVEIIFDGSSSLQIKFKPLSTGLQNLAVIYLSSVIFNFQFSKSIITNTFYIISYPYLSFEHTPAHHLLFHSSFKAAKYSGKSPAFKFRSRSTRFLILIPSPLLNSLMIWSKYFTRPVSLPRRRHITCGTFTRLLWGLSIMVLNYLAPHLRHGRNLMVTTEPSFFPPPSSSIL